MHGSGSLMLSAQNVGPTHWLGPPDGTTPLHPHLGFPLLPARAVRPFPDGPLQIAADPLGFREGHWPHKVTQGRNPESRWDPNLPQPPLFSPKTQPNLATPSRHKNEAKVWWPSYSWRRGARQVPTKSTLSRWQPPTERPSANNLGGTKKPKPNKTQLHIPLTPHPTNCTSRRPQLHSLSPWGQDPYVDPGQPTTSLGSALSTRETGLSALL